jgi:hypothetical protein
MLKTILKIISSQLLSKKMRFDTIVELALAALRRWLPGALGRGVEVCPRQDSRTVGHMWSPS